MATGLLSVARCPKCPPSMLVYVLGNISLWYFFVRKVPEAIATAEECVNLYDKTPDTGCIALLFGLYRAMMVKATVANQAGKLVEARALLERIVALNDSIMQRPEGKQYHISYVFITHIKMALVLRRQGFVPEALAALNRHITRMSTLLPQDHPWMAFAYLELGVTLKRQSRILEAAEAVGKAVAIKRTVATPYDDELRLCLRELACLNHRLGRPVAAAWCVNAICALVSCGCESRVAHVCVCVCVRSELQVAERLRNGDGPRGRSCPVARPEEAGYPAGGGHQATIAVAVKRPVVRACSPAYVPVFSCVGFFGACFVPFVHCVLCSYDGKNASFRHSEW